MAQFTFTDSEPRVYVGEDGEPLSVEPGKTYELAVDPSDGRWSAVGATPATPGVTEITGTAEGAVTPPSGA